MIKFLRFPSFSKKSSINDSIDLSEIKPYTFVLARVYFEEGTEYKSRPVLVIMLDPISGLMVTSSNTQKGYVPRDPVSCGISPKSKIRTDRKITLTPPDILSILGVLPEDERIDFKIYLSKNPPTH